MKRTTRKAESRSFLQANWFPGAIASLALVVAIGGHAFTGLNSVQLTELQNNVMGLEGSQTAQQAGDNSRDHTLRTLEAELLRHRRAIITLREELAALKSKPSSESDADRERQADRGAPVETSDGAPAAQGVAQPLPNGVSAVFDDLVRSRLKRHWEGARGTNERIWDDDVVVLEFRLRRDGSVQYVEIADTSGTIEFDNSVLKAALRMGAVPEVARMTDESYKKVATFQLAVNPVSLR